MTVKEQDILEARYPEGEIEKWRYNYSSKPRSFWSPDKRRRVIFSHDEEYAMGWYRWYVTLADKNNILQPFPYIAASERYCTWSTDSRFFAVRILDSRPVMFIWDCDKERFAILDFDSPSGEIIFSKRGDFKFEINDYGLERRSEILNKIDQWDPVLEDKPPEWPLIRYKKNSLKFKRSELKFYPTDKLPDIWKLVKKQKRYELDIIEDGFLPFRGEMPQSTEHKVNGKRMKIFQLEAFAQYGDKTCQKWLKEVHKKQAEREAKGGNRSGHHTVVKYIGKQNK